MTAGSGKTAVDLFNEKAVLVTGGCGFIGSHLAEALVAAGARVWVLDNLQAGRLANLEAVQDAIHVETVDVRDAGSVRDFIHRCRPQVVFHLAANASVPGSVDDPAYDFQTNSGGTFTVLNALRQAGCHSRVVLASSGAVYGQPQDFPITEEAAIAPISPYGASKAGAELTARMFCSVFGLPVVIARVFNTYGPRMARFVILDFLRKLERTPEALEILGNGRQVRDFTYVSDVVQGLMLLAAQGVPTEAYNLSSGNGMSVTELAKAMIAVLGLAGRTRITYTGSSWPGDAQRWEVTNDKLRRLGFAPQVPLSEGLLRTIEWFREMGVS